MKNNSRMGVTVFRSLLLFFLFLSFHFATVCKGQTAEEVAANNKKVNTLFVYKGNSLKADMVVAKDSSGHFTTIAAALSALNAAGKERVVIYIKDGIYTEKLTINRPNVTLIGESRKGTRIEFSIPAGNESTSRGVLNIFGDGIILQNLTVANTYPHRRHTFALYGRGSYVVTIGCDFIANGNDTVALWAVGGGYYYHADCHFEGNIDFLCPRGWCYVTNSTFYEVDTRAILWHDGVYDPTKKLVIRNSTFSGARQHALGRYPRDSQFYLAGCRFSDSTVDIRDDDAATTPLPEFHWGRRAFFYDCHKAGGDEAWHANNLSQAPGAPKPSDITAAWTFEGRWNPESTIPPKVVAVKTGYPYATVQVVFSEPVTVRGNPMLKTRKGGTLYWTAVNGTNTLTFSLIAKGDTPDKIDLQGGSIVASGAGTTTRNADVQLRVK